jgi:hypothetical protein
VPVEEWRQAEAGEQRLGVDVTDRRQAVGDVARQRADRAAETAPDQRAEGGIGADAHLGLEHRLDLALQDDGLDTFDANTTLGFDEMSAITASPHACSGC